MGENCVIRLDIDRAMACFKESLRIRSLKLGRKHMLVCETLFQIGDLFSQQGDLEEVMTCFEEVLKIKKELKVENDADVANMQHIIGGIYFGKRQ